MTQGSPFAGQEEDRFDRYFNRPLAAPLARRFAAAGLHPNTVSVIGLGVGVIAGWFWQFRTLEPALVGAGLLIVATVLDNTDGMVARLTGKTSEFGKVLDGVCDNFVFGSIYLFSCVAMWSQESPFGQPYGALSLILVLLGAISHSHQSAMTDFYKMEWKFWLLGSDSARYRERTALLQEADTKRGLHRIFLKLLAGHARSQARLAPTRLALLAEWEPRRGDPGFERRYAARNGGPMRGWFLLGPNWHLFLVMVFLLLGRMDLYFLAMMTVWNLILLLTVRAQARSDLALAAELRSESP
jgi:phosphatidylglycerophosphate synthase